MYLNISLVFLLSWQGNKSHSRGQYSEWTSMKEFVTLSNYTSWYKLSRTSQNQTAVDGDKEKWEV